MTYSSRSALVLFILRYKFYRITSKFLKTVKEFRAKSKRCAQTVASNSSLSNLSISKVIKIFYIKMFVIFPCFLQVWTEEGEEESEMTCSERLQAELQAGVNCIDGLEPTCVQFSLWRMQSMEYPEKRYSIERRAGTEARLASWKKMTQPGKFCLEGVPCVLIFPGMKP
jgi:hypothetical protein